MDEKKKPVPAKAEDDTEVQQFLDSIRKFAESHDDIQTLLTASASWSDTQTEQLIKSRGTAWKVATGLGAVALLSLIVAWRAVETAMVPPPPPAVLVMDEATNAISPLLSLTEVKEEYEDALLRRALNTFMLCRERYIFELAEEDYFCAAAFMAPSLQSQWAKYWDMTNPDSPLNRLGQSATVKVKIQSIAPRENSAGVVDTAQVQFSRTVTQNNLPVTTYWVADMAFKMVNVPKEEKQRRINDIGLLITRYDTNEILGAGTTRVPKTSTETSSSIPAPSGLTAPAYSPNDERAR